MGRHQAVRKQKAGAGRAQAPASVGVAEGKLGWVRGWGATLRLASLNSWVGSSLPGGVRSPGAGLWDDSDRGLSLRGQQGPGRGGWALGR